MSQSPILLKNGTIITSIGTSPTNKVLQSSILIRDGKIAKIGDNLSEDDDARVINCQGCLISPGYVDAHRHLWQTQARGQLGDYSLTEYMVKGKWPLGALYSPEDAYLGQLAGALECINAGVTTVLDHFHLTKSPAHVESAVHASVDSCMRIIFAYARVSEPISLDPSRTNNEENSKWQMEQIEQLAKSIIFASDGLIRLGFAYDTLGMGNLQDHLPIFAKIKELGIKHIISHSVPQFAHRQSGTSMLQRWIDGQLLSSAVTFSHSNYLSDSDLELLVKHECGIGSTPEDEMGMSHGDSIVFSALNKGVKVGLVVDCTSIVSGDLFSAMRQCLQSERGRIHAKLWNEEGKGARCVRPKAEDIFRVATLGGAEAIHLDNEIGSVEEGKRVDLIVVRTDTLSMCGADQAPDPIRTFVFNANVSDVDMVIVDERILK